MILIVDDDTKFCDEIKNILRRVAKDVLVALTYAKADELLTSHDFQLVVCSLDLGSVETDGYSLYMRYQNKRFAIKEFRRPTHWIFVSKDNNQMTKVWGLGNSDFLLRRSTPYELLNRVRDTLAEQEFSYSMYTVTREVYDTGRRVQRLDSKIDTQFATLNGLLAELGSKKETPDPPAVEIKPIFSEEDYHWVVFGKVHSFLTRNGLYKVFLFLLVSVVGVSLYLKKFPF